MLFGNSVRGLDYEGFKVLVTERISKIQSSLLSPLPAVNRSRMQYHGLFIVWESGVSQDRFPRVFGMGVDYRVKEIIVRTQ